MSRSIRRRPLTACALVTAVALTACGSGAASETKLQEPGKASASGVRLVRVASVSAPTALAAAPADRRRVYVTEQDGAVRVVRGGRLAARPFLDLSVKVRSGGEQGLLGIAFPRDHSSTGLFYVYYTARDGRQVLEEYRRRSADLADPGSARRLFAHADPESNHNGGQLQFGPDGLLYVATGDGGGGGDQHGTRGNAQNLRSPLGKILRIDPQASGDRPFTIPSGNPFTEREGAVPEIYSYGLRNPWRFSFDRSTGAMTIADVGQDAVEEVNHVAKGGARGVNFGWRPFEGDRRFTDEPAAGARRPELVLRHSSGYCSVTGGYVVRDRALGSLYGRYLFSDYCKSGVRSVRLRPGRASGLQTVAGAQSVGAVSTFGEDASGRIYVASHDGPVYRLAAR